ncbi:MAG: hypothetical protein EOO57_04165 [Hymenobacter sp.]|nr:MAG: hypothetical protein EOO57_04165 [Hymenobacter sp.]
MRIRQIKPNNIDYEYEIEYSQGTILFGLIFGFFLTIGGIFLALWIKSWIGALWPFFGVLSVYRAIKHFRQQGPQLKIGKQGVWTKKTGFMSWAKVTALIKTEVNYRSVTTRIIIINRINKLELASFRVDDLAIDAYSLRTYIDRFSPK